MFLLAIFQVVSAAIWRRKIDMTKKPEVSPRNEVVQTQAYAVLYMYILPKYSYFDEFGYGEPKFRLLI